MKNSKLKVEIILNFVIQLASYVVPLIVAPYISRTLLESAIGDYSYAFSITSYFTLLISFGFDSFGNCEIAKNRDNPDQMNKSFFQIVVTKAFLFVVCSAAYLVLIFSGILNNGVDVRVYVALLLVLLGTAMDISFYFYGREKFRLLSILNLSVNVIYLMSIFLFVHDEGDLLIYTILKSSIHVVIYMILFVYVFCTVRVSKPFAGYSPFAILKSALPFFLPGVAATIANIIDQTMLGKLASNVEVGYYQQAFKIISLGLSLINCINPILLSRVSYLFNNNNKEEVAKKLQLSFQLVFCFGFPAVFGLLAISDIFVPVFYGERFLPVINVLNLLAPTVLLSPLASLIMNAIMFPAGEAKKATVVMFIGNGINVLTNIFLIKFLQAKGAAITTSCSVFIILCLCVILTRNLVDYKNIAKRLIKPFFSAVIMGTIVFFFSSILSETDLKQTYVLLIGVLSGVLVYGIMLLALKDSFCQYVISTTFRRKKHVD